MPPGLSTRTTHKPQQVELVFGLRFIRCWETDKTRSPSVTPDVLTPLALHAKGEITLVQRFGKGLLIIYYI